MRFPPAEIVKAWPEPNYSNPKVRRYYLVPVNIILVATATVIIALRFYARFIHAREAQVDDWLVLVAFPPAVALAVTVSLLSEQHGFNRHIWDFDPGVQNINLVNQRKLEWVTEMLYLWSSNLTKLSLLWFYRRIFVFEPMRRILQCITLFVLAYCIACFLGLLLECRPLQYYWTSLQLPQPKGVCADEGSLLFACGLLNVLIDFAILIRQLRTVLGLHVGITQKIQVGFIFMAGALVVTSSSIRVAATASTVRSYDVTWKGYLVWVWIGIEVEIGLICASLPACKGLFKVWQEKLSIIPRNPRQNGAST